MLTVQKPCLTPRSPQRAVALGCHRGMAPASMLPRCTRHVSASALPRNPDPSPAATRLTKCLQAAGSALAAFVLTAGPAMAATAAAADFDIGGAQQQQGLSLMDCIALTIVGYWTVKAVMAVVQDIQSRKDGTGSSKTGNKRGPSTVDDAMSEASHAHIRSYVDLSEKSRSNPDWQDYRNRSFANNATFQIQIAVKESLPRIRMVLDEAAHEQTPEQHQMRVQNHQVPHSADVDPVVHLAHEVLKQVKGDEHAHVSEQDVHQLELTMAEAVAERAAWEQINMLTKVAHAAWDETGEGGAAAATAGASGSGGGMWPGSGSGKKDGKK